jgi:hypothetical protein
MYHQCRLVLHSSLVPRFSGITLETAVPGEAVRLSAHIALNSALAISQIAADLLALEWDAAQMAPFLGYATYVAASVFISLIFANDAKLKKSSRTGLAHSLRLLRQMKPYWSNLDKLVSPSKNLFYRLGEIILSGRQWARIHSLYEAQAKEALCTIDTTEPDGPSDELDTLAGTKRDIQGLNEPLADSMLEYSLRRVRRTVSVNDKSPTAKRFEAACRLDEVADMLEQQAQQSSTAENVNSVQLPTCEPPMGQMSFDAGATTGMNPQPFPAIDYSGLMDLGGHGTMDWWQTDLSSMPQGFMANWLDGAEPNLLNPMNGQVDGL